MQQRIHVLLTGAGSPASPGVIQSLKRVPSFDIQVTGIDINPDAAGASMVDKFYPGPRANDPLFLPFVKLLCQKEAIDVVLPLVSAELESLAKEKPDFKRLGTEVSVSDADRLTLALHKGIMLQTLGTAGIPIPQYDVVQTADELEKAIATLGYPQKAVCFKPTIGDGSRGFHILDDKKDRFQLLFHEKPSSAYISLQEVKQILSTASAIPELIVMEYLPNEEYSVDILAKEGEVIIAIPRLRKKMIGGITVEGEIVNEQDVVEYCTKIVQELKLHGNIGIQVRRDASGLPKIIEINPRIQGTIVHCTAAGVNLPFLAVKLATHLPIEEWELSVQWGTKMIRYWEELFHSSDGIPFRLFSSRR
ncbi:ATP-grasp domain-containing protein [Fodinisporobacter ferrooxydans]|uniref:ATP-grasp domain-containing protein n=1 Tax=Fodinisporobacter ferrooxydans TaxID=2901836 RepID=A0ABY4CQF7_9BACL|nr:ATP-grasp domain-containing protein [Alicyclobacillaceae bacterium MYW30-H2]